jgi:hypothetical protein
LKKTGNGSPRSEIIEEIQISFWNYGRLSVFLESLRSVASDLSPAAEVYRKLIDGLVEEFRCRKLVPEATLAAGV